MSYTWEISSFWKGVVTIIERLHVLKLLAFQVSCHLVHPLWVHASTAPFFWNHVAPILIHLLIFSQVTGLLLPNPTFASTIFWQWLNQSHNACVNYANRNASKVSLLLTMASRFITLLLHRDHWLISFQETPVSRFVLGYVGAVTSAVGIAVRL